MPDSGGGRFGSVVDVSWSSVTGSNILSVGAGDPGWAQMLMRRPRRSKACETQSPLRGGLALEGSTGLRPRGPERRTVSVCHASSCVDETSLGAMNGFWAVLGTPVMGFGAAGLPTYDGRVVGGPAGIGVAADAAAGIVIATSAAHAAVSGLRNTGCMGSLCSPGGVGVMRRRTTARRHRRAFPGCLQEVNYFG